MYSEKLVNTGNMKMGRCRYGGANKELRDTVGYADTDWDGYRQIENVHRLNGQITNKSCVSCMCLLHVPDHVQLGSNSQEETWRRVSWWKHQMNELP